VRTLTALALGAPLLASTGRAQLGAPPPELDVVRWLNTPALSFEELRGKAVLLEFFRTWEPMCATNVPGLNARYAKNAKKGLMVIGVTYQEPDVVEEWSRRHEAAFPIAVLRSAELDGFMGIAGFPTNAVIDPGGSLAYVGFSPESAMADAMKQADKKPYWPKKLTKVANLIAAGELPKSWAELQRVHKKGGLSEEEADKLARLRSYLEDVSAAAVERAKGLLEEGIVYKAAAELEPWAEAKVPLPISDDAERLLTKTRAEPGFKDELRAGELFEQARVQELRREFTKSFEGYATLIKKFGKTRLAAVARRRAEKLIEDRAVGFRLDCQECLKERRKACDKHHDEVQLD
jgi:peroxiredoxin